MYGVITEEMISEIGDEIMKFIEIANLICEVKRIGVAKLTVGYTIKGECIEHSK